MTTGVTRRAWLAPSAAAWLLLGCSPRFQLPAGKATPPLSATVTDSVFYVAPNGNDANPGTREQPWATIERATPKLRAGQTLLVRGGDYWPERQLRFEHSGHESAWIVVAGYPGERALLNASKLDAGLSVKPAFSHDDGTVQIQNVHHIRVEHLNIVNSHQAGITVRDASHIKISDNHIENSYSSGISAWDSDHDSQGTEHIAILRNTVTHANTMDMLPRGYPRDSASPHEAISIGGAQHFEVAYNHVYNCDKEGIDVKEVSKHGRVHHNRVHHVAHQGLYVDAWFGAIEDIEIDANVVYACVGAGLVFSVENGDYVSRVRVHHNVIYDNLGTGIFFSRWDEGLGRGDGPRFDIEIHNNTVHHNGYGKPAPGQEFFWITGGIYLYSTNLEKIAIRDNIVSQNNAFQIGYNESYLEGSKTIAEAFSKKRIAIHHNLLFDPVHRSYPLYIGYPPKDYANVYSFGNDAKLGEPLFVAPANGDFRLRAASPALAAASDGSTIGAQGIID